MQDFHLIGFTGKARCGKDTAGDYLIKQHNFTRYGFADPLKRACAEMFGVPIDHFYNDEFKEEVIPFWGYSPRQMAQMLGTEGGRDLFDKDIWVKRGTRALENAREQNDGERGMVLTDVRFENEATWIRDNGGLLVHVWRNGIQEVSAHSSEDGVKIEPDDFVIENNDSLEFLYENVDIGLAKLLANKML